MLQGSGMTIFPRSVLLQSYAPNVLWFVAAASQALPTGEHSYGQRYWVGRLEGSGVPLARRATTKNFPLRPHWGAEEVRHLVLSCSS